MARPDNLFNVLFVKWSWGWTLTFVSLFVGLTSFTTSCGRKDIIKNQGIRLVIGKLNIILISFLKNVIFLENFFFLKELWCGIVAPHYLKSSNTDLEFAVLQNI